MKLTKHLRHDLGIVAVHNPVNARPSARRGLHRGLHLPRSLPESVSKSEGSRTEYESRRLSRACPCAPATPVCRSLPPCSAPPLATLPVAQGQPGARRGQVRRIRDPGAPAPADARGRDAVGWRRGPRKRPHCTSCTPLALDEPCEQMVALCVHESRSSCACLTALRGVAPPPSSQSSVGRAAPIGSSPLVPGPVDEQRPVRLWGVWGVGCGGVCVHMQIRTEVLLWT